ncbi:MAG: hypothetical protein ABSF80_09520 [Chitinispirillaceae bacterium]
MFLILHAVIAQGQDDYFIVADPTIYTIYNQYQQPLSASEMAQFVAYAPFQIINKKVTLGDQITHAVEFLFQQKTYYLLMADDGKYTGEKSNTCRQIFFNVEAIGDTIETLADGLLMVSGTRRNVPITKGTLLIRVFKSGPRFYIAALNDRITYGWSLLEPKRMWRKSARTIFSKNAVKDTGLSETLKQRILTQIASANELYKTCFSHFNSLTGDDKAVSQWRCEINGNCMYCKLVGPDGNADQLSISSQYLVQEIENLLMGTDFGVVCKKGEIVIEKRSGNN